MDLKSNKNIKVEIIYIYIYLMKYWKDWNSDGFAIVEINFFYQKIFYTLIYAGYAGKDFIHKDILVWK